MCITFSYGSLLIFLLCLNFPLLSSSRVSISAFTDYVTDKHNYVCSRHIALIVSWHIVWSVNCKQDITRILFCWHADFLSWLQMDKHVLPTSASMLCMGLINMITKGHYPKTTVSNLCFTYPSPTPDDYPSTHSLCEFSFYMVLRVC